ncbi:2-C-methyl-D-erythritol 4-phosphate cytidylyltransferase [Azospirillum sp. TSH58]|uniref:2-C-methyl-D-erythritol 4-phosphate cytidylyltransferase n=1 Tax=Azospirillum sp. TSH58 TaxID=664962 RepID=UPI00210FEE2E|nr:2-C-methyl-D-erythritol 4-phosphate cytidylyltransferase [Azospirillum sp. TSH58]
MSCVNASSVNASSCIALIVAAGTGQRFGAERPKQYLDLAGQPFCSARWRPSGAPKVSAVRVVINPAFRDLYDAAVAGLDLPEPVAAEPPARIRCATAWRRWPSRHRIWC